MVDLVLRDRLGQLAARVLVHQHEDAAPRAALDDAAEPAGGFLGEPGREIGNDQEPVGLGDLARLLVVRLDRLELVAQILLDDRFHVLGQVGQPLLDVPGLRPDAGTDEPLVVVGQPHKPRERLPEPDRVHHRQPGLARGQRRQHAQHGVADHAQRRVPSVRPRLHEQRRPLGHVEQRPGLERRGQTFHQRLIFGQPARQPGEVGREPTDAHRLGHLERGRPVRPLVRVPRRAGPVHRGLGTRQARPRLLHRLAPVHRQVRDVGPVGVLGGAQGLGLRAVRLGELLGSAGLDGGDLFGRLDLGGLERDGAALAGLVGHDPVPAVEPGEDLLTPHLDTCEPVLVLLLARVHLGVAPLGDRTLDLALVVLGHRDREVPEPARLEQVRRQGHEPLACARKSQRPDRQRQQQDGDAHAREDPGAEQRRAHARGEQVPHAGADRGDDDQKDRPTGAHERVQRRAAQLVEVGARRFPALGQRVERRLGFLRGGVGVVRRVRSAQRILHRPPRRLLRRLDVGLGRLRLGHGDAGAREPRRVDLDRIELGKLAPDDAADAFELLLGLLGPALVGRLGEPRRVAQALLGDALGRVEFRLGLRACRSVALRGTGLVRIKLLRQRRDRRLAVVLGLREALVGRGVDLPAGGHVRARGRLGRLGQCGVDPGLRLGPLTHDAHQPEHRLALAGGECARGRTLGGRLGGHRRIRLVAGNGAGGVRKAYHTRQR